MVSIDEAIRVVEDHMRKVQHYQHKYRIPGNHAEELLHLYYKGNYDALLQVWHYLRGGVQDPLTRGDEQWEYGSVGPGGHGC